MVQGIPDAARGFTLLFSAGPFPGHQATLEWRGEHLGDNWYHSREFGIDGWIFPALLQYVDAAPERIYAQFKPKAA
jgi:hypothetical protein